MNDSRPHVVHMIDELPPDGAERLLVDVLQNRSDDYRYTVLCLVDGGPLERELTQIGVPVVILNRQRGFDAGTIPALIRWLRNNDVAVVHTHLYAADTYGRIAALLAGVPGRFSTRHNVMPWKGFLRPAIARLLSFASTKVIACGAEIGRAIVRNEGISASRVSVVANGVNLRRFEHVDAAAFRRELQLRDGQTLMGVIGRLHPQKGHMVLLDALSLLKARAPDFLCALVGSGDLKDDIAAAIRSRGLERHVVMVGQRGDIPDILAALDLFVLPSLWEGLPMALLEGMALNNAVVATRVGSVPDVIEDGVNGLLVEPNDAAALAAALERMLTQPELRSRLRQRARETVLERYNAAVTAASYEALYAQALGRPQALRTQA